MNVGTIRFVVTAVITAVVAVMGAGSANAAGQQSTHTAATYLQQMHDYMRGAVAADDVAATSAAVQDLRPVLAAVDQAPVERATDVLTGRADDQAAEVERALPGLDALKPITDLLSELLATLTDLVSGLLGSAPAPAAMPAVPMALPAVPGVQTPVLEAAR
jgi:hypothetical protein